MCYRLFSYFSCGHTKEHGLEQCELIQGTQDYCSKISAITTKDNKLCYECAIEADALNLGRKDIDNLAETLLNELDDEPYNQVNHGFDDHAALAERLRRVSNLYSQKLFNAESQLQLMKESFAEKGRTTSSRGSSSALKLNSLDSLRHKLEGFNAYWRREVRFYEGQLEKAGREHSTWSLVGIQNRLGTVHEKWAKQIEDILRGAEGALE